MKTGYACENCNEFTESRAWIFDCVWCGKEICESCFDMWGACKECSAGKTESELKAHYEKESGELGDPVDVITDFLTRTLSK
jgi:hypothetical protein